MVVDIWFTKLSACLTFRTQIASQRDSGLADIIGFGVWIRICLHLVELYDLRKRSTLARSC
jgi:hypothetical protein